MTRQNAHSQAELPVGGTTTEYRLLSDHRGLLTQPCSQSITANSDGSLNSEVRYSAFGETRYTSATEMPTDYLYIGQRIEEEAGLYYYHARFYDPVLSHFVQADTVLPKPDFSLSYDRYAYVNFNPIAYSDPTGHMDYGGDSYDPYYGGKTYTSPVLTMTMGKVTHAKNCKESQTEIRKYKEDDFRAGLIDMIDPGNGEAYSIYEAYMNSGMSRFTFATTLLHPEFFRLPTYGVDLSFIPLMIGTGFQMWRLDGNQSGSVYADLANWLSSLESPRGYIINFVEGINNTIYDQGEIPLAAAAISYAISETNLADIRFMCSEYAYWANDSYYRDAYGRLPNGSSSISLGTGNIWIAITIGESLRLSGDNVTCGP